MKKEKMGRRLLQLGGSFLILVVVSFTMLWVGDKLNASGMAVTRFLARMQAPLTAQFSYPAQARDQITVVLYDHQYLKATGSAWPISYQDHADWLLRLTADPGARPKAIMLDITFGQERDDPTVASLQQALCTIQNEYRVPVFLAALPSPENGQLRVRSGLRADKPGQPADCFTLVGVDYVPDPLDGLAWSYQLSRHWTDDGWQPGPSSDSQGAPAYRSAAMSMAQDVAHIDLGEETVPMALVWGHNSVPQTHLPDRLQNCRVGQRDYQMLIPGVGGPKACCASSGLAQHAHLCAPTTRRYPWRNWAKCLRPISRPTWQVVMSWWGLTCRATTTLPILRCTASFPAFTCTRWHWTTF